MVVSSRHPPPEEDHGLRVRILLQHDPEEGRAGGEHQFVRADNVPIAYLKFKKQIEKIVLWLLYSEFGLDKFDEKYEDQFKYLQMLVLH